MELKHYHIHTRYPSRSPSQHTLMHTQCIASSPAAAVPHHFYVNSGGNNQVPMAPVLFKGNGPAIAEQEREREREKEV